MNRPLAIAGLLCLAASSWLAKRAWAATPADRYVTDVVSNTVTDTRTGLVWRRAVQAGTYTWGQAKEACSGGFRLPFYKELLTLVDPTRINPAIDPVFRGETATLATPSEVFWSASPFQGNDTSAWDVDFRTGGNSGHGAMTNTDRVRCVR